MLALHIISGTGGRDAPTPIGDGLMKIGDLPMKTLYAHLLTSNLLYVHTKRSEGAILGGYVIGFQSVHRPDLKTSKRVALYVQCDERFIGVAWRGTGLRWLGGKVPATLPHELALNTATMIPPYSAVRHLIGGV